MSSLIIEQSIFAEASIVNQTQTKAIFKCPLQSVDEINQNKRLYERRVLEEGMQSCRPRIQTRAFFSELDHPIPT
jgi:hypothetical protein